MNKKSKENLTKNTLKNLLHNTTSFFVAKLGGFILTIILARVLLPESFGIYVLVFSIVTIISSFTDLGIEETAIRYASDALGKKKFNKVFSYFLYSLKLRFVLLSIGVFIILIFSKVLAYDIFNEPGIFVPLLFAIAYLVVNSFRGLFASLFFIFKDLSEFPLINLILHGSKILFSLIALMLFSGISAISAVFIAFSFSSLVSLFSIVLIFNKKHKGFFSNKKVPIEKKRALNYLVFVGIANLSLVLYGSVSTIMLGLFVEPEFIGYYQAAFSLIASLTAVFSVSGIFIPIFTQLHGKRLKGALSKSLHYIFIISIPATIGLVFVSKPAILLFYGKEYLPASSLLYILSFLLLVTPVIEIYSSLFKAKEKTRSIAFIVFMTLLLNIILNYFLIVYLLDFGQEAVILGVASATLISRSFYLLFLVLTTKPLFKIEIPKNSIMKSIFATLIMVMTLIFYNYYLPINVITGLIEILLGISVYMTMMFLIKGITKEDIVLFKSSFKKD